ncbi:MAG TPA: zinc-ribbon domain-containing protein [Blastocatellia bacterium]|nr:zinc-ribbon domain-containing protein [Blastocatellia bacterium]
MANFTILEPMSTGDVIDRTVRLYRRNFTPMVAIVAIPSLIGYATSMMFWFGYMKMLPDLDSPPPATPEFDGAAMIMLGLGTIGYPVWFFAMVITVAALSRVVGDHIMLGEPVTFKKCFSAVRRRLGDITLMGLLSLALMMGLSMALYIVLILIVLVAALIIGATGGLGLPPWMVTVVIVITVLIAVAAGIYILLHVVARVVFLPQVVMIEGQSVGSALSRAMSLGGGNWYRVGGIMLFTYFVSLSLLAAFTIPFIIALQYFGLLSADYFFSPGWNVIYGAFNQISNLLVLPIWIVSFTLLYFDSRVRKEAYDLELLAREVSPGFYWRPVARPPVFGYYPQYYPQPGYAYPRPFVQTSPLGLAGYMPPPAPRPVIQPQQTGPPRESFTHDTVTQAQQPGYQAIAPALDSTPQADVQASGQQEAVAPSGAQGGQATVDRASSLCWNCGAALQPSAQFCIQCGKRVAES